MRRLELIGTALLSFLLFGFTAISVHADDLVVVDYLGRSVSLDKPAQRIIALAPHIVENIFSAGAGDKIVGVVNYSDYPLEAKTIPKVGAISAYSIETIVALKPDLVVLWHSGRGGQALDTLTQLGLKVYADDPKSLNDIARSIRDFGVLSGTRDVADTQAEKFSQKKRQLESTYQNRSSVKVFYQIWNSPMQTLNGKHIVSDVMRLCGGVNVFNDALPVAPKVSVESVIQADPQVIIASGDGDQRPDWLDDWRRWSSISAVKHNHLYFIPPDYIQRHTLRMLEGVKLMCEEIDTARKLDLK